MKSEIDLTSLVQIGSQRKIQPYQRAFLEFLKKNKGIIRIGIAKGRMV